MTETNNSNDVPANDNERRRDQSNNEPVDEEAVTETRIDEGNDDINNNTLNDMNNNNNTVDEPNNNNITYSAQTTQHNVTTASEVPERVTHLDNGYPIPSPIPLSVPPPMYHPPSGSAQDLHEYQPPPPLHHPQPQPSLCPCPAVYSDNSYFQLPPPDYQELSPSQLQYQPTLPSYASCAGNNVQWKWVGHGWAPVSSNNLDQTFPQFSQCLGCPSPGFRHRSSLRNRKIEIVLWVFIIFLLVVIGLLTYSHLQLLTSLNAEGTLSIEVDETRSLHPPSPPLAHRPGASPVAAVKEFMMINDDQ